MHLNRLLIASSIFFAVVRMALYFDANDTIAVFVSAF